MQRGKNNRILGNNENLFNCFEAYQKNSSFVGNGKFISKDNNKKISKKNNQNLKSYRKKIANHFLDS